VRQAHPSTLAAWIPTSVAAERRHLGRGFARHIWGSDPLVVHNPLGRGRNSSGSPTNRQARWQVETEAVRRGRHTRSGNPAPPLRIVTGGVVIAVRLLSLLQNRECPHREAPHPLHRAAEPQRTGSPLSGSSPRRAQVFDDRDPRPSRSECAWGARRRSRHRC